MTINHIEMLCEISSIMDEEQEEALRVRNGEWEQGQYKLALLKLN